MERLSFKTTEAILFKFLSDLAYLSAFFYSLMSFMTLFFALDHPILSFVH